MRKQVSGETYIMRSLRIRDPQQYYSGDHIEKNEMGRACSTYGERRSVYSVLVGETLGKIPIGRPRHRGKDDIKMHLQEVGWEGHVLD